MVTNKNRFTEYGVCIECGVTLDSQTSVFPEWQRRCNLCTEIAQERRLIFKKEERKKRLLEKEQQRRKKLKNRLTKKPSVV